MHFARAGTGPSRTAIPGTSPAQAPVPRPRDRSAGRNRRRHQSLTSQERLAQPQPDGSASPTAERQRYSASTRPQGKRTPPRPVYTPNASLPVIRQPSRRERQPNRRTPALQRKHTTTRQAQPASASRRVPGAEVRSACRLPEWFRLGPLLRRSPAQPASPPTTQHQPNRRPPVFPTGTPAQPPNASATAQAHDHKASATSFGTAVSTRAARSSRPGSTSFGGRDSPRHIRADSINSVENGHKN